MRAVTTALYGQAPPDHPAPDVDLRRGPITRVEVAVAPAALVDAVLAPVGV